MEENTFFIFIFVNLVIAVLWDWFNDTYPDDWDLLFRIYFLFNEYFS